MFGESGWTLTHVLITLVVLLFVTWGALAFFARHRRPRTRGSSRRRKMNLRNFFEYMAESVYGMVEGAMGEENAPRFFPLIGALWLFILFDNLFALIPGFSRRPTRSRPTSASRCSCSWLTHYYGVRSTGSPTSSTSSGPSLALIPLMLPIELISHIARPMSLAVRLMGNMMADHKVVMSFFALVPILVPLPFLLLGLLVCLIQALVFCTLTMVYIGHGDRARGALIPVTSHVT